MKRLVFTLLTAYSISFAVENPYMPLPDKEMMKKIEVMTNKAKQEFLKESKNFIQEDGQIKYVKKKEEKIEHTKEIFNKDERLYIFMSSSVPKIVWTIYAKTIDENNLGLSVPMILRGCIGGCTKIMPTLKFISNILTENGDNPDGLKVDVEIDPLLFGKYQINEVPCFVYAKNVNVVDYKLSEGLADNLKEEVEYFKSCGDDTFEEHIKKLYEKSQSSSLKSLYEKLTKNKFYGDADEE